MKKNRKINQIVVYYYIASLCIFLIVLAIFAKQSYSREIIEQRQLIETNVISSHKRITDTIETMSQFQKNISKYSYVLLKDNNEKNTDDFRRTFYNYQNFLNERFMSILFSSNGTCIEITPDIPPTVLTKLSQIYSDSNKDHEYTTFFIVNDNDPNIIYIYNAVPVYHFDTSQVRSIYLGSSVFVSKINASEYTKYLSFSSSVQIFIFSGSEKYYITKNNNIKEIIADYTCYIDHTNWQIHGALSKSPHNIANNDLLKLFCIEIILLILFLIIVFQFIYKRMIKKPIKQIIHFLKDYVILNHDVEIPAQSSSEFNEIVHYISFMIKRNRKLIEKIFTTQQELYEKEVENKVFKLHVLKAQINPHFLYNSLDDIASMAYLFNVESIADAVNILSKILRYTINDQTYSLVKDEIALLNNYFSIIKIRYSKKIVFKLCIDPELNNCKILHMMLQPIVENSIKHNNMHKKKLIIYVKGYKINDHIRFVIIDNGKGMSTEKINSLNLLIANDTQTSTNSTLKSDHIGIRNINQRIKIMSGPEYGISLQSKEGQYTKVIIDIPYDRSAEKE